MQPTPTRSSFVTSKLTASVMLTVTVFAASCGSATTTDDLAVADIPETTTAEHAGGDTPDAVDGGASSGLDSSDEDSDGEVTQEDAEAAQLRYEQCLADEGIENPFGDGEDGSTVVEFDEGEFEQFEAAQEICDPILEDVFGSFELSPEQEAAQADAELAFNTCMADKGFEFSSNGGDGQGFEVDGDTDIEEFEAAADECDAAFDEVFGAPGEGDDQ